MSIPTGLSNLDSSVSILKNKQFDAREENCFPEWSLFSYRQTIFLLVGINDLISKYSLNLQYFTLICMYLTSGLTEFILIRIHSLPTITGYNWYEASLLISSPISSSSGLHAVQENVYRIDPH